jgi:kinesin family protein C2/C3
VHGPGAGQATVFEYVRPLVDHALNGTSATVFAYGQTGAGKTHSMEGTPAHPGITVRAVQHLFGAAPQLEALRGVVPGSTAGFHFSLSVMEIYQERIRDLLVGVTEEDVGGAPPPPDPDAEAEAAVADARRVVRDTLRETTKIGVGAADAGWSKGLRGPAPDAGGLPGDNLPLRETAGGGVEVVGLTRLAVASVSQALEAIRRGAINRAVGAHALNEHSSRSHMVVRVWVDGPAPQDTTSPHSHRSSRSPSRQPPGARVRSVVHLVDLAGSERVLRTLAEGERLREATAINSSLSTLGSCVAALRKRAAHVPFRDSKLTHVLKDSMSGAAKVLMLACVSGDEEDLPETLATLNFASRCRATALGAAQRTVVPPPASAGGRGATPQAYSGHGRRGSGGSLGSAGDDMDGGSLYGDGAGAADGSGEGLGAGVGGGDAWAPAYDGDGGLASAQSYGRGPSPQPYAGNASSGSSRLVPRLPVGGAASGAAAGRATVKYPGRPASGRPGAASSGASPRQRSTSTGSSTLRGASQLSTTVGGRELGRALAHASPGSGGGASSHSLRR